MALPSVITPGFKIKLLGAYCNFNGASWNPDSAQPNVQAWKAGRDDFTAEVGAPFPINAGDVFTGNANAALKGNISFTMGLANQVYTNPPYDYIPSIGCKLYQTGEKSPATGVAYVWNDAKAYADVAAGLWDASWKGIVDAMVAQGRLIWFQRVAYEADESFMQDFAGYDNQPLQQTPWIAAMRHVFMTIRDYAKTKGAYPIIGFNPSASAGSDNPSAEKLFTAIGVDVQNCVQYDEYNGWWGTPANLLPADTSGKVAGVGPSQATAIATWNTQNKGFGWTECSDLALKYNLPLAVMETGASGGDHHTLNDPFFFPWLASAIADHRSKGGKVICCNIWSVPAGDGSTDIQFGKQPATMASLASVINTIVGDAFDPTALAFGDQSGTVNPPPPPPVTQVLTAVSVTQTTQDVPKVTQTTWADGTATWTSPFSYAPTTAQPVNPAGASTAIAHGKPNLPTTGHMYWEYDVDNQANDSLGFLYTAFVLGFGETGSNYGSIVQSGNPSDPDGDGGVAFPSGQIIGVGFSYNLAVIVYTSAGGYIIHLKNGNPSPNVWNRGDRIGVEYNADAMWVKFYINGVNFWGQINLGNLSAVKGSLLPLAVNWNGGKPSARINDGTFAGLSIPSGAVSLLAAQGGVVTPPASATWANPTVIPNPVTSAVGYSIKAVKSAAVDLASVKYSSQSGADSFVAANSPVTVALSTTNVTNDTVTFGNIKSTSLVAHTAKVQDKDATSAGTTYLVQAAAPTPPPPPPTPPADGIHAWAPDLGLRPSTYTFSNDNKTAFRAQSFDANIWTLVFANDVLPNNAKTYLEIAVTGFVTGTAAVIGLGWNNGQWAKSGLAEPVYMVDTEYNGFQSHAINDVITEELNARQWTGNTPPPGWQLTPGSGLEGFAYEDTDGNIHLGYATINTSLKLGNNNTQALVIWGGTKGLTTVIGAMVDLINMQVTWQWKVLATGFTGIIGPFPIPFDTVAMPLQPYTSCQTAFLLQNVGLTATINGGAAGFTFPLPAGYTAWDGTVAPPPPPPPTLQTLSCQSVTQGGGAVTQTLTCESVEQDGITMTITGNVPSTPPVIGVAYTVSGSASYTLPDVSHMQYSNLNEGDTPSWVGFTTSPGGPGSVAGNTWTLPLLNHAASATKVYNIRDTLNNVEFDSPPYPVLAS